MDHDGLTARMVRLYAEAADEGLSGVVSPHARSTASLTAAAFLFSVAIAEASLLLSASAIDSAVLDGVDRGCQGLARGATEILEDKALSEKFETLSRAISAGVSAIVTECALICSTPDDSTMVN